MREVFWLKGKDVVGDGFVTNYVTFWKMLCYRDTGEPISGKKIEIDYREYSE